MFLKCCVISCQYKYKETSFFLQINLTCFNRKIYLLVGFLAKA
jgi:hypothetical protein